MRLVNQESVVFASHKSKSFVLLLSNMMKSLEPSTGHKHLVAPLIEGGADPNIRNGKGFTLLHQAIVEEDSRTSIYLLDHGADMNAL